MSLNNETKIKKNKLDKDDNIDINKNILNRITYLINKRLSNFNLNRIENIYENTKTLISEFEKQNNKMFNKISVLENLLILLTKDMNELKKKIKNQNKNIKEHNEIQILDDKKNNIVEEKKVEVIQINEIPLQKINSFSNYMELKKEKFNLDFHFVKSCLESHNINSDLKIFKNIYTDDKPNSCYPIRHIKGNFQYWLNNKMNNDDENATYIKDTIIHNITNIYLDSNIFDNYKNDTDTFIKNQEYILNMSKSKYKEKFLKNILKIIEV